ncbi:MULTISPECIES: SDR family NAD(P)-dependent oxidoreductase [Exiguobacterium]|uniref:SDR family NAD(P)-dependent oxidoreductase n=1 Tax=Exiguobacterium antarcticum TaxID=132920 RepID=A0ABT6R0K7_9BACL|nr:MULTISPECIES: SDR family NAD(P)-dependent oxidoreductase [Exiguobacterium]MCT4780806.1 SDR family NAD(P)-dependent oxidoreductase [Exiguobacterium soli]MDI3234385.1 SDR family NAD(P)-dependent oxidoreductase [Exiguobacterium antarcticum]
MRTIFITGASSGIGLATATRFADEGWTVYAGIRQVTPELEQHTLPHLHFLEVDVTDLTSLKQAVSVIEQEAGHLNALFCNAGQGLLRALGQATSYEIKQLFDTNVFGVMRTIECCLPLLKAAPQGSHLLATSSISGLVGQPMNEIYCASKFALEGLFESLATYYKPFFSIDVTLIEPAAVETNFTANVLDRLEQTGGLHDDDFKPIVERYLKTYRIRHKNRQAASEIAELIFDLVQSDEKPLRVRTAPEDEAFVAHKTANDPSGLVGTLKTRQLTLNLD